MHQRLSLRGARVVGEVALLAAVLGIGCGDSTDDAPACLPMLARDCTPDPEPPSYANLYADIFSQRCGTSGTGTSCHGPEGKNGLVLAGIDTAYDELLGHADGRARVLEENPECSVLVQRLESDDPAFRMPRSNAKLNERQLCAVRLWIANGAKRDED
jgi:mono/diheme cytochrome c family protein